jgi:citrate synthase
MPNDRYMSAAEAANALGVSLPTLYAYVSRGLIRSSGTSGQRHRRYYTEDIEKLVARKEGRRNPEQLAQDALHWGAPVLESALTLIDGHRLYYRGIDFATLARNATIEQVAALLWTGEIDQADKLFNLDVRVTARLYETMLMHIEMDGANLLPIQLLMTMLPIAASDDQGAYDLRPAAVMQTGARILRLMGSVLAGDVPENIPIAAMLAQGLRPGDERAERMLNALLVICADHELNASSFTARVVASVGATPYAAVIAGLAALGGIKHGGYTERVETFLGSISTPADAREWIAGRLRRGEDIPGFGHKMYPLGDPRAALLLALLQEYYPDEPRLAIIQAAVDAARELINELPAIDFSLVAVAEVLGMPRGSALGLFALGRTVGWIGHAIEQYSVDRIIRPRARYTGALPDETE